MSRLPYSLDVRVKSFNPKLLDCLIKMPFCFFLDSGEFGTNKGRYSYAGINPVRVFSSSGGFITIDQHTFIDNPIDALERFESAMTDLPLDPYLPFQGGLVGFVGHGWPHTDSKARGTVIPDAWFGLYDTILTYDHLENSCWVTSMGISGSGSPDLDLAKYRCEELIGLLEINPQSVKEKYIIRPLVPDPVSDFSEKTYVGAVDSAKKHLDKRDWLRATVAQRFHAPVATDGWSIHKLLREKNPTPFASFLRCGSFEVLSTSPSCFLKTDRDNLICNVVQKSIACNENSIKDKLGQIELLHSSPTIDPVVVDDENSLIKILNSKPFVSPAHLESDTRSHYLINQITAKRPLDLTASRCLGAAMPGASMTGVPKRPVNNWIRNTEPAGRNIYTGAIGYIDPRKNSQFNMAVRTMIVKDQVAYVHAGLHIEEKTEAEDAFHKSKTNIKNLFEDIKSLGSNGE